MENVCEKYVKKLEKIAKTRYNYNWQNFVYIIKNKWRSEE